MLGDTVKGWRLERRWKQTDVVKRSKGRLTQTYLSKLEGNGITTPTRAMMEALADVYEKPIAELYRAAGVLEGVEDAPPPPGGTGNDEPPAYREDGEYSPEEVGEIVAWVRSLPGVAYRRIIAENERDLSPDDFVAFCLDTHTAWMSNLRLAHKQQRRRWNGART